MALSTYAREQDVLARYKSVRRSAKTTKTDKWLRQWESTLRDIKERKLPEVDGICPTRAFLQAVEKIQPAFANHWSFMIESKGVMTPTADLKKEIRDGFQIAQMFRNHVNLSYNTKGAFTATTLQGEEALADSQSSNRGQKCVSGYGKYPVDQYYILNKHLRPKG